MSKLHYLTGERVYAAGKPRAVCTSAAMREGWDDARSVAACAATSNVHPSPVTN